MAEPHTQKSEECDCCGFPTPELEEVDAYGRTPGHGPFTPDDEKQWAWLCHVCRNTHVGNIYRYPRNYQSGDFIIGSAINYGTNLILDEIRKGRTADA